MDRQVKHLEMIQAIVSRMASNLFFLRGWTVALVSTVLALTVTKPGYIVVAYLPIAVFWILDGYFLWQERLFRALYDDVRQRNADNIDFSMDTSSFVKDERTWVRSCFSRTLLLFYVPLWAIVLLVTLLTR